MSDVNNVPRETEGNAENSPGKVRIVFSLMPEVDRRIEVLAATLNMTKSQLVTEAVAEFDKNRG